MFCDFPKYKHLKQTIYRGPGGGGNATTDAEINTLTALTNEAETAAALAGVSASEAALSASAASTSEAAALASATAAALSEAEAATQAANAAISASGASTSASAAATSASAASTSAAAALASQTAAASSASSASTDASTATTQASNAAASASSASTSASTATTQASNAASSASAASTSATTASTQASNASASASAAASSASGASTSAANAATSASEAADSAASINDANLVHKTGDETIGGIKTFSSTIVGSVSGNAATVTTNANLTGAVTSVGNATTISNSAVTYTKLQNVTAGKLLGRDTSGSGVVQELPIAVDASGNVGIGTSSPGAKLDVAGDIKLTGQLMAGTGGSIYSPLVSAAYVSGTSNLFLRNVSGVNRIDSYNDPVTSTYPLQLNASQHTFYIADAERARIDSSGNLLVGTTSQITGGSSRVTIRGVVGSLPSLQCENAGTGGQYQIVFANANGAIGRIETSASSTNYITSSDYRLKNTIAPMTGALAKVALLKPCTYKWIVDGSDGQGFIAHELAEVVPGCVSGEKDAVDAEGKPQYQGIDTSFLVATLTAAIQEQQAMILQLQIDVAQLRSAT